MPISSRLEPRTCAAYDPPPLGTTRPTQSQKRHNNTAVGTSEKRKENLVPLGLFSGAATIAEVVRAAPNRMPQSYEDDRETFFFYSIAISTESAICFISYNELLCYTAPSERQQVCSISYFSHLLLAVSQTNSVSVSLVHPFVPS